MSEHQEQGHDVVAAVWEGGAAGTEAQQLAHHLAKPAGALYSMAHQD
ncbi:hypothetical protein ACWD6R_39155 [Streptomyces sp. NPDC005151]